jgi:hypothetical protein
LQKFKLPEAVLCIGGILQVELLGRVQKQEMDGLYYIWSVSHCFKAPPKLGCYFHLFVHSSYHCFASFSFLHNQVVFVCLFVSYFLLIMFWCSVSHVQVVGRPLSSPFDIEINNSSGKCTLKYNPETQSGGRGRGRGRYTFSPAYIHYEIVAAAWEWTSCWQQ